MSLVNISNVMMTLQIFCHFFFAFNNSFDVTLVHSVLCLGVLFDVLLLLVAHISHIYDRNYTGHASSKENLLCIFILLYFNVYNVEMFGFVVALCI